MEYDLIAKVYGYSLIERIEKEIAPLHTNGENEGYFTCNYLDELERHLTNSHKHDFASISDVIIKIMIAQFGKENVFYGNDSHQITLHKDILFINGQLVIKGELVI